MIEMFNRIPWLGTALTAGLIVLLIWWPQYVGHTLSPTFLTVVISVYFGGLYWGLASVGLVIGAEAFLLFPDGEYGRFVLISLTLLGIVWLVAVLQRKARFVDNLNGNLITLHETIDLSNELIEDWERLTRPEIKQHYLIIHDKLINLTTRAQGWHQLYMEMSHVKEKR